MQRSLAPHHVHRRPRERLAAAVRAAPRQVRTRWRKTPPWARWTGAVGVAVLAIVLFFAFVFQWNWLRGPLAHVIAGRLHRDVAITGDLHVHPWSWSPSASVEGLVIGNPDWAGPRPMATLPRVAVAIRIPQLLRGHVVLPLVEASSPDVRLVRDRTGRANWSFGPASGKPLKLPAIQHFIIDDGRLRIDDARRRLTFEGRISSNERVVGPGRGVFTLTGRGSLNGEAFGADVTGGPLLNVDPTRPYPFRADVHAGATHIWAAGTIPHPFDLGRFGAQLRMSGPDLADLYPLTGLALPATPPYRLSGDLTRIEEEVRIDGLHGVAGESDLSGFVDVKRRKDRPFLAANLVSRRLRLVDLAAVLGGGPKHTAGQPVSPLQAAQAAKLRAQHRVLPDAHLQLDRVRGMDADVTYRAETVVDRTWPVKKVLLKVGLDHGVVTVDPLRMTLPQGDLSGRVRIDARHAPPTEAIDLRLAGATLQSLIRKGGANPPVEGSLVARARLTGTGDSVRAAAGSSDGVVSVAVPGGRIRQSLAELLGINATKALFLMLSNSHQQTPVRCAVADFDARGGVLTADRIVLDTGVVLAKGKGTLDLRNETLDLRLEGKSKKFRLVRVMAPITLKGRFEQPKVGLDLSKAAGQLTVGGVLAAVVSPLAAILPFVTPGTAKDADCGALLAEAAGHGAPVRAAAR